VIGDLGKRKQCQRQEEHRRKRRELGLARANQLRKRGGCPLPGDAVHLRPLVRHQSA
jgi:hypothetical protein